MNVPSKSTDLVKFEKIKSNLPKKINPNEFYQALELVDKDLILKNRKEVKKKCKSKETQKECKGNAKAKKSKSNASHGCISYFLI